MRTLLTVSEPAAPASPSPGDRALNAAQRRAVAELIRVEPVIEELGQRFHEAGHELALVGGPVRDALLGRLKNDLDFATSARPADVQRLLRGWADHVWDVGIAFGTVGARRGDFVIEVTTYRSEAYDRSSRKPDVTYGESLEGD